MEKILLAFDWVLSARSEWMVAKNIGTKSCISLTFTILGDVNLFIVLYYGIQAENRLAEFIAEQTME